MSHTVFSMQVKTPEEKATLFSAFLAFRRTPRPWHGRAASSSCRRPHGLSGRKPGKPRRPRAERAAMHPPVATPPWLPDFFHTCFTCIVHTSLLHNSDCVSDPRKIHVQQCTIMVQPLWYIATHVFHVYLVLQDTDTILYIKIRITFSISHPVSHWPQRWLIIMRL